jgi:hypothetical protein
MALPFVAFVDLNIYIPLTSFAYFLKHLTLHSAANADSYTNNLSSASRQAAEPEHVPGPGMINHHGILIPHVNR